MAPSNKTKKIDLDVCKDAKMLFSRERSGHVGYLQYGSALFLNDSVQGADLWAKVRLKKSYYLGQEEDSLLAETFGELKKMDLGIASVTELGPGDYNALASKTVPLIQSLGAQKYVAVDMSEPYAHDASEFISKKCFIESQYVVSNFLENVLHVKQPSTFLFMAGSTISNISVSEGTKNVLPYLTRELMVLRDYVDDRSFFLVGFDSNQDMKSLDASYCFPDHARLIEDILWRIERDTNFILNPEDFEYYGRWIADEHRYGHFVKAIRPTSVTIDDRTISFVAGETLLLDNSYKYPLAMFKKAAESAGWIVRNSWTDTGRAHYVLLEAV